MCILMFMHVIPCGPAYHFFEFRSVFHPCSIRVSSVAQGSLASLLSGTSVRSVAKEQDRASVPHFLAKPKVRPLPTELQIGSLLPARSLAEILDPNGQNTKTRRVVVLTPDMELAAGFPIAVAGVTGTLPNPLTADFVKLPYKLLLLMRVPRRLHAAPEPASARPARS